MEGSTREPTIVIWQGIGCLPYRFEAISRLILKLENDFAKSKDKIRTAKIREMIAKLKEMIIPIVIFDGLSESEEKQLFHDLNNLSQRPSRNANIRLNQTDYFSQIARELAVENRYLTHYGVEMDKMSISGSQNPNTILLSTIYASSKEFLGLESRHKDEILNAENYTEVKKYISDTFDKLFFVLPNDINQRNKYLIEKSFAIKSIARFIHHARTHLDLQLEDEQIFDIIKNVDWTYNIKAWKKYGGVEGAEGNILFTGGSGAGMKSVYMRLMEDAVKLAEKKRSKPKKKDTVEAEVTV